MEQRYLVTFVEKDYDRDAIFERVICASQESADQYIMDQLRGMVCQDICPRSKEDIQRLFGYFDVEPVNYYG